MRVLNGAPESLRHPVAALFSQAFAAKLAIIHGHSPVECLAARLDLGRCLVAMQGAVVVGVAGYVLDGRRLMRPPGLLPSLRARGAAGLLGWAVARLLYRREQRGLLLMDGVAVRAGCRGQGIGSGLLDAVRSIAVRSGRDGVRLDVVDTNPGALKLYLRVGFVPVRMQRLGVVGRGLLGFSSVTTLVWPVDRGASAQQGAEQQPDAKQP